MRSLVLPLILLAAACGDDGPSKQTDAGTSDATDIDAALGTPVKLTVTSNGTGIAGVRVHFQGPDSAVIASMMTDASGVASSPVPAGGFVTAVNPSAPGGATAQLKTFSGVQPGDELVITDDVSGAGLDLDITAPTDSGGTVTGYRFTSPCWDSRYEQTEPTTPSYLMPLDGDCLPSTDLIVASRNASDEIVNYLYAANVTTSGGVADLSSMSLNTAPTTKTYTYNNMPAGSVLDLGIEMNSSKGRVISFNAGGTGTAVAQQLKVTGFTGATEIVFGIYGTMYGQQGIAQWAPFSTNAYTVDAGALALHPATSGVSFAMATGRASWTEGATGAAADFALAETRIFRSSANLYIYWDVIAQAGTTEIQFPTLPIEGVDYNVLAGDTTETNVTLGKVPGGWDGIREKFFTTNGPSDLVVGGTSGSLVFQNIADTSQLFAPVLRLVNTVSGHKRNPLAAAWKSRRRM